MREVLPTSLAALWSLGTVNYGTAFRHNLTTNWLLLVAGGPAFLEGSRRALRRMFARPVPLPS